MIGGVEKISVYINCWICIDMKHNEFDTVPSWCPYTTEEISQHFEFLVWSAKGMVKYKCVHCKTPKHSNVNSIRMHIRRGTFTSLCNRCRGLIQRNKKEVLLVKKIPSWMSLYFNKPSSEIVKILNTVLETGKLEDIRQGNTVNRGLKTFCICCYDEIHATVSRIKTSISRGNYTGICRTCLSTVRHNITKNSKTITNNGYALIQKSKVLEKHHYLCDWTKPVMEHRYLMAMKLNRPLTPDEIVHHIDGNKENNTIENLELWNNSHPSGQRISDKLEWAQQFIEKYKKETI